MSREEFLVKAIDAARVSSKSSGLPAGITVAQAALESSWGNSELSRRANNYFGIKAHGEHASVEMPTREVVEGRLQKVAARFAAYEDMAQCFTCRDRLILGGAVYKEACASKQNPELFARALAQHWATDPQYADKLLAVYRANKLSRLDESPSSIA